MFRLSKEFVAFAIYTYSYFNTYMGEGHRAEFEASQDRLNELEPEVKRRRTFESQTSMSGSLPRPFGDKLKEPSAQARMDAHKHASLSRERTNAMADEVKTLRERIREMYAEDRDEGIQLNEELDQLVKSGADPDKIARFKREKLGMEEREPGSETP